MKSRIAFIAILASLEAAPAQTVSFGFAAGTSLTPGFRTLRFPFAFEGREYLRESKSEAGGALLGASIEIGLRPRWSLEFQGVRRKLTYRDSSDFPLISPLRGEVTTWQFPMLVKRRFAIARNVHPFLGLGPSFRTIANPSGSRPKRYGATAAAGVELARGPIVIAPSFRFTRWASDNIAPFRPTIVNQLEFVTTLQYGTETHGRTFAGKKIWFGFIGGLPLTNDLAPPSPGDPPYTGENKRFANFRSVAGLMAEFPIARALSMEANGLYRRLHFENQPEVVVTWQIPMMAKYTFQGDRLQPFVEAGPSFRASGNLNGTNPGKIGFTAGAGLAWKVQRARLTPVLRYTRWSADGAPIVSVPPLTKRDQVEMLVGLSF